MESKKEKVTERFEQVIKEYLDGYAKNDELFAGKYHNEKKNIADCCTYILNTVQKSGANGFTDEEVFGMAIHYYDEESIDIGERITAQVVINRTVELTDEEKAELKKKAMDDVIQQEKAKLYKKPTVKSYPISSAEEDKPKEEAQTSLF